MAVGVAAVLLAGAVLAALAVPTGAPAPRLDREAPVTATDRLRQPANNSPVLVADPTDDRFVVLASRLDAPAFNCALHVSGDGGRSWVPVRSGPTLPEGAESCYGPEVAFDRRGTLYFLFVGLAGPGHRPMGAFLSTSTDRGRSFSPPRAVLGPLSFAVRLAIDPDAGSMGRVHLVWIAARDDLRLGGFGAPPNPIMSAHSDDAGATFSTPVQVSDPGRSLAVAPALAVGPDHRVHVAYYDLGHDLRDYYGLEGPIWEEPWSVVLASSLDGGRTFGPGRVIDGKVAPPERVMGIFTMPPPSLVADGDRVCAAWSDARHGDPDAFLGCSADGGVRWSAPRRLNDDGVGDGHTQSLPRLAVAPNGRIDAVFLDRRGDPDNSLYDTYFTSSTDGGRTFSPNVRLTGERSSSRIGQSYSHAASQGLIEFGGRLGLLSRRDGAVAAWPDTRYSRTSSTSQDLFSRLVQLPVPGRNGARRAAVGLLAAAVLVAVVECSRIARRRTRRRHDLRPNAQRSSPRRGGGWLAGAILTALAVAVAGGLATRGPSTSRPLPPPPQVVDVVMREYRYEYDARINAGRVVFRVRNAGSKDLRFELYPLPDDMPPIDEQLHGPTRRNVNALAVGRIRPPGTTETLAVDLEPGRRYALISFLFDPPDGEIYAMFGMNSEFRAMAPPRGREQR